MEMIIMVLSVLSLVPVCSSDCIRFEFHESIESSFHQSDLLRAMCLGKAGKIVDYELEIIQFSGPLMFNVTFHCCAPSVCLSDHDCPVNFNCNYGLCTVAGCTLTDEPEIILQEGRACFIDDDCYFDIPFDSDNWKCLPDPWCFHNKTCDISYNYCKRCPTGYIDADPKRFEVTSNGSAVQPPPLTTSSPYWLTEAPTPAPNITPPTTSSSSSRETNLFYNTNPIDRHEHSVPNISTLSTLLTRVTTSSTTPDPITVGYDELSPNTNENHSNNNSGGSIGIFSNNRNLINNSNSINNSSFGASDLPVNLSDDELISNVSFIEITRLDSVDDEILNSTDAVSPSSPPSFPLPSPLPASSSPYENPSTIESSELPLSSLFTSFLPISTFSPSPSSSRASSFSSIPDSTSSNTNFESRSSPVAPLVTANPFAWPGLFDGDLNRTVNIRNLTTSNIGTTNIPNFTDINYI